MTFREIIIEDIPELFRVRVATWHTLNGQQELDQLGITPASVQKMMEFGSHRGWLCAYHDQVVGFAMGNRLNGEMWVIAVLKEYENRGIGKRLLNHVEQWLASEGWHEVWLTTDLDENDRAVGFYKHLGWTDLTFDQIRTMKKNIVIHTIDTPGF
ncbi:GNAT family N-acetyltransferase [bacterium]|nr:GNAT family N-acetyltransferase [bacterium]